MKTFTLTDEQVTEIFRQELSSTLEGLLQDYDNRENGSGFAIFDLDRMKDLEEIQQHIDAFKLVLSYY
jgi:hypothetical protein